MVEAGRRVQRYRCAECGRAYLADYVRKPIRPETRAAIGRALAEGVRPAAVARIFGISAAAVAMFRKKGEVEK